MNEPIGSTGAVAGFRDLVAGEQWHRADFVPEMLEGGWRPLLLGETSGDMDSLLLDAGWMFLGKTGSLTGAYIESASRKTNHTRTKRPLPTIAPQSNNAAMRLDIAKHALQGLLSNIGLVTSLKKVAKERQMKPAHAMADFALEVADALILRQEETKP